MKTSLKALILLLFTLISTSSFAQSFVVLPDGLRDALNTENSYLVLDAENLDANQLYKNALKYIANNYGNPDEVIVGQIEGESLTFKTYIKDFITYKNSGVKVPISARFTTKLDFKEGKVKYEIMKLEMPQANASSMEKSFPVLFSGGMMSGLIVYKKNGNLFKPQTKTDIENVFNGIVAELSAALKGESKEDDW